jgi:hypothetical protein
MLKASGIVLFAISVILAAGFVAIRYFAVEIPYVPFVGKQPEIVLLVGYVLLLIENLMGGLPGFRRQAGAQIP